MDIGVVLEAEKRERKEGERGKGGCAILALKGRIGLLKLPSCPLLLYFDHCCFCYAIGEGELTLSRPFNLGPMGFATSSPSATSGGGGQSNSPVSYFYWLLVTLPSCSVFLSLVLFIVFCVIPNPDFALWVVIDDIHRYHITPGSINRRVVVITTRDPPPLHLWSSPPPAANLIRDNGF